MKKILVILFGLITLVASAQWQQIDLGTDMKLFSLDYYSNDTIFINKTGSVYKSVDAGLNWVELPIKNENNTSMPATYFNDVHHFNSNKAVAVGLINGTFTSSVVVTNNSDVNWTISSTAGDNYYTNDVCFVSDQVGIMCSEKQIHRTTNGGQSWSLVHSFPYTETYFLSVDFFDEQKGICVGKHDGEELLVITNDGGLTWTHTDSIKASCVRYATEDILYATSSDGIYKSTDSGISWVYIENSPIGTDLYVMSVDTFFVSWNGVFRTFDGGAHWEYFPEIQGNMFHDIDFSDDSHACVVGEQGKAYKIDNIITACAHPIISFNIEDNVCLNTETYIENTSLTSYSYQWFVDGIAQTTDYNPSLSFSTSGEKEIKLVAYNGCYYDTLIKTLNVVHALEFTHSVELENDSVCTNKHLFIEIENVEGMQTQVDLININNDTLNTIVNNTSFNLYINPVHDSIFIINTIGYNQCDTILYSDTIITHYFGIDYSNLDYYLLKDTLCHGEYPTLIITNPEVGREYGFYRYYTSQAVSAIANGDTLQIEIPERHNEGESRDYNFIVSYDIGTLHCTYTINSYDDLIIYIPEYSAEIFDNSSSINDTIQLLSDVMNIDSLSWFFDTTAYYKIDTGFIAEVAYDTIGIKDYYAISRTIDNCIDTVYAKIGVNLNLNKATANNCFLDTINHIISSVQYNVNQFYIDNAGNYLLGGYDKISSTIYSPRAFLKKYDKNGNFKWKSATWATQDASYVNGIQSDNQLNTYICGRYYGRTYMLSMDVYVIGDQGYFTGYSHESNHMYVAKIDSLGEPIWMIGDMSNNTGGNHTSATDILYVNDDSIYVFINNPLGDMVFTNDTVEDFDWGPEGHRSAILLQINSDGEFINKWGIDRMSAYGGIIRAFEYSPGYNDYSRLRIETPRLMEKNGKVILYSELYGTFDFDNLGEYGSNDNSYYSNFYAVLDPQVGWESVSIIPSVSSTKEMSFDNQGNMYFVDQMGSSTSDIYSNENPQYFYLTLNDSIPYNYSKSIVYKYDDNGNLLWYRTVLGMYANKIKVLNNDSVAIFGNYVDYATVYNQDNTPLGGFPANGDKDVAQINFSLNGDFLSYNNFGGKDDDVLIDVGISACGSLSLLLGISDTAIINGDNFNYHGDSLTILTMPLSDNQCVFNCLPLTIGLDNLVDANYGVCNGYIDVNTYPSGNYNYIWETGEQTDSIGGLCAGTYNVTVESVNNGNAHASFQLQNIYEDDFTFVDTLISSIDTCVFDSSFPIDSAFIYDYNLLGEDSVVLFWVFWQDEDSILLEQPVAIDVLESSLVYFDVVCNQSKSINSTTIYQFYGVFDFESSTVIQEINGISTLKIFPNPASDRFSVTLDNETEIAEIEIYNLSGDCLLRKEFTSEISLSTNSFDCGIYIISIKQENLIINQKLVIDK